MNRWNNPDHNFEQKTLNKLKLDVTTHMVGLGSGMVWFSFAMS